MAKKIGGKKEERNIILEVKNVSKFFDTVKEKVHALNDMNFVVYEKEFLGIVGPSGCGKSTLLRIIGGIEPVTHGEVLFHGKKITSPTEKITMVFQNFALLPWKTAYENIMLPLENKNIPDSAKDEIVDNLLSEMGLMNFKNHYPRELSGGMKQRIGIARALAVSPSVLLLDEPFSALDEITATELRKQMLMLWHRKDVSETFVLITHSVEEAVLMSDRVLILSSIPGHVVGEVIINVPRPRFNHVRDKLFFKKIDEIKRILKLHEKPLLP